jgi:alkyl hydroperoxide reductase subunit AhpC
MSENFSLRLGATVPNLAVTTTQGDFRLHDFIKSDMPWTVLMSHPKDFTPVCTTELGRAQSLHEEFKKRGAKLIAVSCDSVSDHQSWSEDITYREKCDCKTLSYPIIADVNKKLVTALGMLDPMEVQDGAPMPARALIVFDQSCTVRLALLYPASTGRNFDEVLRCLDSLNVVSKYGAATPVEWQKGDKIIIPPNINEEEAMSRFKNVHTQSLPSGKEYMRSANIRE